MLAAFGAPQLLCSVKRDSGAFRAELAKIANETIFYETLTFDIDTLLWLNRAAMPIKVISVADVLVRQAFAKQGEKSFRHQ